MLPTTERGNGHPQILLPRDCPLPACRGHNWPVTTRQRIIVAITVCLAFGCLGLAAAYSGDTSNGGVVFSGGAVDGGGERLDDPNAAQEELDINPIERWFPQAGEGSGCSEPVGVDLIPGYSALLTINGTPIAPEDTNALVSVDTNNDGITDATAVSAGGSQGQITWGPETDCPFGEILRPTNNRVTACIYRVEEGPENCRLRARPDTFDF